MNPFEPGAVVLQVEQGHVGRVARLLPAGEHVGPPVEEGEEPRPVDEPVVELDGGDRFLARAENFVRLLPAEEELHRGLTDDLRVLVADRAALAASEGGRLNVAVSVISAALLAQLRALSPER